SGRCRRRTSARRTAAGWSSGATRCGSSRGVRTNARHPPFSADNRRQTDPSRPSASCLFLPILFLLPRVAAGHDEFGAALVLAGFHAVGGLARRRRGVPAAAGAAAERMVDRIHGLAANVPAPTFPAVAAGLADRDIHVVRVRHRADGRQATTVNETLLAGIEA